MLRPDTLRPAPLLREGKSVRVGASVGGRHAKRAMPREGRAPRAPRERSTPAVARLTRELHDLSVDELRARLEAGGVPSSILGNNKARQQGGRARRSLTARRAAPPPHPIPPHPHPNHTA